MKLTLFNNIRSINEIFLHRQDSGLNDKTLVMFGKDVWIFDEEEYYDAEIYKDINKEMKEDFLDDDDFYTNMNYLEEELPYVIKGEIRDNTLYISGYHNYRTSNLSDDLKKLKRLLNIDIKVLYGKGRYLDDEAQSDLDFQNLNKNTIFYHGTSLNHLRGISKKGILPITSNSNFKKVKHKDKIFITTNIEKALFHANTSSINNNSFPIILKLTLPDTSKLIRDYDLAIDFYGEEDIKNVELGYSNIHKDLKGKFSGDYKRKIVPGQEKTDLSKKLGIYGYKGRIPASHIKSVMIDIITYQKFYFNLEYDKIDAEHEMWDDFADADEWSEYNFKEIFKILDEVEDNYLEDEEDY